MGKIDELLAQGKIGHDSDELRTKILKDDLFTRELCQDIVEHPHFKKLQEYFYKNMTGFITELENARTIHQLNELDGKEYSDKCHDEIERVSAFGAISNIIDMIEGQSKNKVKMQLEGGLYPYTPSSLYKIKELLICPDKIGLKIEFYEKDFRKSFLSTKVNHAKKLAPKHILELNELEDIITLGKGRDNRALF